MAVGSAKFSYGIADISAITLGGNGYTGRYHVNKYAVDLGGVDYIRVKQPATGNIALVIATSVPNGGFVPAWQSAWKSATSGVIATFQGTEIPSQYKTTGLYIGIAYTTDVTMNHYQTTNAYAGLMLYNSTGGVVYNYTNFVVAMEINYLQYYRKFLFQDGTDIVKFVSGARTVVGTAPATESMFNTSGMNDLIGITSTQLNLLTQSKKLMCYNSLTTASSNTLNVKAVPNDKLVIAKNDVSLLSSGNVDNFTLTATTTNNGVLNLIASPDSGVTWYTYLGGVWTTINPTIADVKANGMTMATFNVANWNTLLTADKKLKFAYLLSLNATTDVAEVDKLTSQVDMQGYYFVDKDANHDVCRVSDSVLEVSLYSNGDYKISYLG
jgi:hypothetical protein